MSISKALPDLSKLEPLDGTNYKRWSQKLLIFFEQLDVDYVLFTTPPEPDVHTETSSVALTPVTYEGAGNMKMKYDRDNKTVRGHLLNHMSNILFDLFVNQKSTKEIWNILETRYGGDDAGRKKYVVGKWLQFHMTGDKTNNGSSPRVRKFVADVLNEGMKMCDVLQANVLLEKFPPSWSEYRNHLKHKKKDLNLQEFISHMRTEEANRLKDKEISNSCISFKANLVESSLSRKDRLQPKGKKFQKGGQQKTFKGTDGKIQKIKVTCYCCGKLGHKANQCFQRKDQQKTSHKPPSQPRPQISLTEQEEVIAAVVVEANLRENKINWILDTGASKHFCSNKELFQDFQEARDGECVFMGNSTTTGVLGKGNIFLKLTSGKTLALIDVLYVPFLRRNLISGSLLNKAGLKIVLEADKVIITKNGDFVGKGTPMIPSTTELRSKRQKTETSFGPDFLTIFLADDIDRIDDHLVSAFFVDKDPKTYIEAVTSVDSIFWKEAIKNELDLIMENHTWDLVDLPRGSKPIKCKWIFKKKIRPDGSIDKFKARLVVVGYTQRKAFLNGDLNEEIYMEQPEGFAFSGLEDKVCQEAEWLRNLVGDMPMWGSSIPVSIHCDSQAAIGIAKNYAYNGKRRHIRIRYGAVKELLKNGIISLEYVRSERNEADPLTKGLTRRIIL
ncbi:Retrovirus-related Pol polyprotein from transposon TNT 1-94 [Sesamum angolense]|uniref:Retrovirus-related Pol polyprotein from transposon TNT 1-94 n=1 Tax=Sesamum angolense TaxID=2727404 RepID=A0AAE1VZ32_9LAMI|nr:Retrovirus-related Pol polyprotein from transposon TNT 1-94 [Sesamum angolense]